MLENRFTYKNVSSCYGATFSSPQMPGISQISFMNAEIYNHCDCKKSYKKIQANKVLNIDK